MLNAHAVLVISKSGMSAATMSSARPAAPITARPEVCRKIALLWGVIPVLDTETGSINPNELTRRVAMEKGLVEA
jgi:pyruvate kinase